MERDVQDSERDRERRGTAAGTVADLALRNLAGWVESHLTGDDPAHAEAWAKGALGAQTLAAVFAERS